jgi:hypothetical protein
VDHSIRIYAAHACLGGMTHAFRTRSVEPPASRLVPQRCPAEAAQPQSSWAPVVPQASPLEVEGRALAVLEAPADPAEPIELAFRRKEHELRTLFGVLSSGEALVLFRRLTLACPDDNLASKFARLVAERRARLLAFLEAAPRREALAHARRR